MTNRLSAISISVAISAMLVLPAQATPNCVKEAKAFTLSEDSAKWTMTIVPGAECIQGLRWSYMQIYNVTVISGPSKGRLAMVGPGFRYFADPSDQSVDKFTLLISGKNRRDPGSSTLEVEIHPTPGETISGPVQPVKYSQAGEARSQTTP
jgi:hypothetical protein